MRRPRLLWQIYPSYLLGAGLGLIAITWYTSTSFRAFYEQRSEADLLAKARLASGLIAPELRSGKPGAVNRLCKEISRAASARLTPTQARPKGEECEKRLEMPVSRLYNEVT